MGVTKAQNTTTVYLGIIYILPGAATLDRLPIELQQ